METGNQRLCFTTKALLHFRHKKSFCYHFLSSPPPSPAILSVWAGNLADSAQVVCCPFVLSSAQPWWEKPDKFPPSPRE